MNSTLVCIKVKNNSVVIPAGRLKNIYFNSLRFLFTAGRLKALNSLLEPANRKPVNN